MSAAYWTEPGTDWRGKLWQFLTALRQVLAAGHF
jgi:hypothetical protein